MPTPAPDPTSALAVRTQYRQSQSRAARLRLLVEAGQELTRLTPDAMRQHVLQRACAFTAMDHGLLLESPHEHSVQTTATLGNTARLASLGELAHAPVLAPHWLEQPQTALPSVLRLPLRGADDQPLGMLLLASSTSMAAPDSEDIESLQLLATLLAAHLENNRLLTTLIARERSMSELVHRLFSAQEDERKRVAYDLHDGLAQTLAGLHQRLQGFAGRCPELPAALHSELQGILALAQHSVGEGRQLISGLRPHVLDDFGLLRAIDKEADRLRDAGIEVIWQARCADRLPAAVEIGLFRIAQEGINNVLKHARCQRVTLALHSTATLITLVLQDDGRGFNPDLSHAAQCIGLVAMQERASLLGGRYTCTSQPGPGSAQGTRLDIAVPITATPLSETRL